MTKSERIYLSPPHMSGHEMDYVQEAFDTNWIAPIGPNVTAFEEEMCAYTGAKYAVALGSGTAAIHLGLIELGVGAGDEVIVSTLTFSASVNPILYQGATPIFIDSEPESWNMDPALLTAMLEKKAEQGRLPKAVVLVHIYGQTADVDPIKAICHQYGIPILEDAAEALGATYRGQAAGTLTEIGILSFNGNKIITTSGGGMILTNRKETADHIRKLSTQARDQAPHYQHSEIGYNYRMSNILAGVGRGQLMVIEDRVATRRRNADFYTEVLGDLPGGSFMPEAEWGRHNRWLTVMTIDPKQAGIDREKIRLALEEENIEARPVWKPMHLQPIFEQYEYGGGTVAESFFNTGLCLPSGSALTAAQLERICATIKGCWQS